MATLSISLDNFAKFKKSLRELQVRKPRMVLLYPDLASNDIEFMHRLSTFRFPPYVTDLEIPRATRLSGELAEVVSKLIVNGPSSIHIGSWPECHMDSLLDALMDKKNLSTLCLPTRRPYLAFAKLVKRLQSFKLRFSQEAADNDWSELANAISASSTLTKLTFSGSVPEAVFPSHLPVNLRELELYSDLAFPFDWLSHDYWPSRLERLELTCYHRSFMLPKPEEIVKARLRRLRSLTILLEPECVDFLLDIVSVENHIDKLSFGKVCSLDTLVQVLRSPFVLMSNLSVTVELEQDEIAKAFELVRAMTRAVSFDVHNYGCGFIGHGIKWFPVMQTLLAVHELPRLKVGCVAGMVPWRDHILRVVVTLGWRLRDYCTNPLRDYCTN